MCHRHHTKLQNDMIFLIFNVWFKSINPAALSATLHEQRSLKTKIITVDVNYCQANNDDIEIWRISSWRHGFRTPGKIPNSSSMNHVIVFLRCRWCDFARLSGRWKWVASREIENDFSLDFKHTSCIGLASVARTTTVRFIGVARGAKAPPIFRTYSHFVLWEAFYQTK